MGPDFEQQVAEALDGAIREPEETLPGHRLGVAHRIAPRVAAAIEAAVSAGSAEIFGIGRGAEAAALDALRRGGSQ